MVDPGLWSKLKESRGKVINTQDVLRHDTVETISKVSISQGQRDLHVTPTTVATNDVPIVVVHKPLAVFQLGLVPE